MKLYAELTEFTALLSALLASEAAPSVFLLRLGLLLSSCEDDAITRLRSDLQEVFGEEMAQADRPQALQLWDQLCRRRASRRMPQDQSRHRPVAGESCWAGVVPHRKVRLGWRHKPRGFSLWQRAAAAEPQELSFGPAAPT